MSYSSFEILSSAKIFSFCLSTLYLFTEDNAANLFSDARNFITGHIPIQVLVSHLALFFWKTFTRSFLTFLGSNQAVSTNLS